MTRRNLEEKKRRLLDSKPVLDAGILTFQAEMAQWDAQMKELGRAEKELERREGAEREAALQRIANLEMWRDRNIVAIGRLKKKYTSIGARLNRAKDYKSRQWDVCLQVADLEAEVSEIEAQVEVLIGEHMELVWGELKAYPSDHENAQLFAH